MNKQIAWITALAFAATYPHVWAEMAARPIAEITALGSICLQESASDETAQLIEKARQGNAKAYTRLAEHYHRGEGVEHSFINMTIMYIFAEDCGGKRVEEEIEKLDKEDTDRILFDGMTYLDHQEFDQVETVIQNLKERGVSDHQALQALLLHERDKAEEEPAKLLREAADGGSDLAQYLYVIMLVERGELRDNIELTEKYAKQVPFIYNLLGRLYLELNTNGEDGFDLNKAMKYLQEADRNACLSPGNAERLINCYKVLAEEGEPMPEKKEIKRLERLSENDE